MNRILVLFLAGVTAATAFVQTARAQGYDFGDFSSNTLVSRAWAALEKNDLDAVLAYTNKCVELYGAKAREMQAGLKDYASGSNDAIFKYWALNDVATSYFIQGEAYLKAGKKAESQAAFSKVVSDFSFGQCWDPKGWFWKPADAAQRRLAELSS